MSRFLAAIALLAMSLAANAGMVDIDQAELERLARSGVTVIDIRTSPEWEQTGIVPGSRLLTFFDEQGRTDPEQWLARARGLVKPGEPVALICRSGNRSRAAGELLVRQGAFPVIYNVRGGIQAWKAGGLPVVPATSALASCRAARTC